jgi:hypothetical protein
VSVVQEPITTPVLDDVATLELELEVELELDGPALTPPVPPPPVPPVPVVPGVISMLPHPRRARMPEMETS